MALWRELGDKRVLALALVYCKGLGWVTLLERRVAEARALFAEGVALCQELGDKWVLASALWRLGAAIRRDDPARPTLEKSVALGREVGDKGNISEALQRLGEVVRDQGDYERALALFGESVALAQSLEQKENIARGLVGVGGVASAIRQGERSARLLSAAETLLDAIGLSLAAWPEVHADYDRYVAAAHTQLDAATFAAAWAAGQTMTLDDAVAYDALVSPASITAV